MQLLLAARRSTVPSLLSSSTAIHAPSRCASCWRARTERGTALVAREYRRVKWAGVTTISLPSVSFCTPILSSIGEPRAHSIHSIFAAWGLRGCASGISAGSVQRKAGGQGKKAIFGCSCTRPIRTISRSGLVVPRQRAAFPAAMNRFLDRHGVLDADYERAAKDDPRFEGVLLRERTPTALAGSALVIVDSADTPTARLNAPDDAVDATSARANRSEQTAAVSQP